MQKEYPLMRVDNEKTLDIWSRRLAAGAGQPGFGNARDVRQDVNFSRDRLLERVPFDSSTKKLNLLTRRDVCGGMPLRKDSKPIKELAAMQGLESVKKAVIDIAKVLVGNLKKEDEGSSARLRPCLHRLFLGNPGTGKTTVAKIMARLLCEMGVTRHDEVVVKTPQDLKGAFVGEAEKLTKEVLEGCRGKVLFIDEAYSLGDKNDPYYGPVVDTIVGSIHGSPDDPLILFMAGYREEMDRMLRNVNPGLRSRMQVDGAFMFEDYSRRDLSIILRDEVARQNLASIDRITTDVATSVLEKQKNMKHFGNARQVKDLLGRAMLSANTRTDGSGAVVQLVEKDFAPERAKDQTNTGPGIKDFPTLLKWVETQRSSHGRLRKKGREPERDSLCFVFRGNPGNGKTTAARLMGEALVDLGLLGKDDVVEKSVTQLQTGYVGQAGARTREILDEALGGVLFIDEAYRLDDGNKGYGREILDELVSAVTEEKYMGKVAVILAGYSKEMQQMLNQNPGLSSRFGRVIDFEDFTPERCAELFVKMAKEKKLIQVEPAVERDLAALFETMTSKVHHWANARDVINFVDHCYTNIDDDDEWCLEEVRKCGGAFMKSRPKPEGEGGSRVQLPPGLARETVTRNAPPPALPTTAMRAEVKMAEAEPTPPEHEDEDEDIEDPPETALMASLETVIERLGVPAEKVAKMLSEGKLSPEIELELIREGYTSFEINCEIGMRAEFIEKRDKALKKRGIKRIKYCTVCGCINCNFRPVSFDVEVDLP